MNLPPPHQGWRAGNVLIAFVGNARADAENCQAFIKVAGMTREFESLGWRYLAEQAGIGGSLYLTLRRITIPPNERGEAWIAVMPEDGIWRIFPSFPELSGFDSYRLDKGKSYEVCLRVIGRFKPKEWNFNISIDDQGKLSHTNPKEA